MMSYLEGDSLLKEIERSLEKHQRENAEELFGDTSDILDQPIIDLK